MPAWLRRPSCRSRRSSRSDAKTPIVQFGTSRFLQAHADLFISDAMREGQAVGPVTVVQTSGAADRAGRLAAFDGRPLPIVVRGLENGEPVERTEYTHLPRPRPVDRDRLGRGRAHRRRGGGCRSSPMPATAATACRRARRSATALPVSFPGQADQAPRCALGEVRRAADASSPPSSSPTMASSSAGSARRSPSAPACRRRSSPGSTRTASFPTAWSTASPPRRWSRPARSPSPMRSGRSSGSPG